MTCNGHDEDKHVSTEILDENVFPNLYSIVKKFMIHGPCGDQNHLAWKIIFVQKNFLKIM